MWHLSAHKKPCEALSRIIKSLKPGGKMYMGFIEKWRVKYFIIALIRTLIDYTMFSRVKYGAILESFGELNHYQTSRLMDDFFHACINFIQMM